jgi:hypothetical protein
VEVVTDISEKELTIWEDFQIVQCRGCDSLSFRKDFRSTDEFGVGEERGGEILLGHEEIYPPRVVGRPIVDRFHLLPHEVKAIYLETHKALCSQQPVLTGIGIRALIETVCKERVIPGRNLAERIDGLVDAGVLTKSGAEILHKLRTMGNLAAHEVRPHSESELGMAFGVVDHLLLGVYILPSMSNSLPTT